MNTAILFVCLGNICRSPTAEGVARAMAAARGVSVTFDSCGTGNWHVGSPPDARAQAEAATRGYGLRDLRARQLCCEDFDLFDLILAMDRSNLRNIEQMRPVGNQTAVRLMLDFAPDQPLRELPDPYYEDNFGAVLSLLEVAVGGVLDRFEAGYYV